MRYFILFLIMILGTSSVLNAQELNKIVSAEISFVFISKDVDGSISGFESTSTIDIHAIEESKFRGSVEVETIKTGNFLRDWSLKGKKYFDADTHPKITFESTTIESTPNGFNADGNLTIKAITKPITFRFERSQNRLIGTTTLFSNDYGVAVKSVRADNEVRVKVVLTLE